MCCVVNLKALTAESSARAIRAMSTLYEKQMEWRKASASKAAQSTAKDVSKDHSFTPIFYTQLSTVKPFEGPARDLTESAGKVFIDRNARARREKQMMEDKLYGRTRKTPAAAAGVTIPASAAAAAAAASSDPSSSKPGPVLIGESRAASGSRGDKAASPSPVVSRKMASAGEECDSPLAEKQLQETLLKFGQGAGGVDGSGDIHSLDEMSVVEILEHERRQWHAERIKLIHCIHLQQLELAASGSAAQGRASEIAKEFARAIEGFEERLVNMESNVQKELLTIKAIATELNAKPR